MSLVPVDSPLSQLTAWESEGRRYLHLPTSMQGNQDFFTALAINAEKRRAIRMPSRNIELRLPAGEEVQVAIAKLIRREGYFLAMLIQSRGVECASCANKCALDLDHRFPTCVRIHEYQDGACAECVQQSYGAQCQHWGHGDFPRRPEGGGGGPPGSSGYGSKGGSSRVGLDRGGPRVAT